MRAAFTKTLLEAAKKDKRIVLLTADLGFSVLEEFIGSLPNQFINAGVAEQNMTGMASGLAIEGYIPFIYSIIPFITMRNFEQIRNDICYQHLNVKVVGVGAGFSYGSYGHTHHALEDIGIMRMLPEMTIVAPADTIKARLATVAILALHGPCYLRIGKAGEPVLYEKDPDFHIGKGIVLTEGKDVTLVATSTMVSRAVEVSKFLERRKISVRVISMHTLKPIDENLIVKSARNTKVLVTLEEHSVIGGLGSIVSEVLIGSHLVIPFHKIAVPDRFTKEIGSQEYMRGKNGLGKKQIVDTIQSLLAHR